MAYRASLLLRAAVLVAPCMMLVMAPGDAHAKRARRHVQPPVFSLPESLHEPIAWTDLPGWSADDHAGNFKLFRTSCRSVLARKRGGEGKAVGHSLNEPCRAAQHVHAEHSDAARIFFEHHFVALRIARLGDAAGFVTGYYEPIVEGSRTQSEAFPVPVYKKPSNLFVRGYRQNSTNMPNKGQVFRKIGRRKLVPYYDRGAIEDGALAGHSLELCWVRNHTDLLFMQIQGSARIRLEDGSTMRLNYDAHNGHPYTPVGRVLIERGLVPKEEMSMQRIRKWIEDNPDGAQELRRQNKSFVFFREVKLADHDEPAGAQGVPLTPQRSIAVDKALHVYGTPFYIYANLPLESPQSQVPFQHLMLAQDTGSAIIGPARADIYFGAGVEAGRIAGQLRHPAQFAILVPKALDPVPAGRHMPLPKVRPSEKIAKLFPQSAVGKESAGTTSVPVPPAGAKP